MATTGFVMRSRYDARAETYTRVPKRVRDCDGTVLDFEATLLDPRNWRDRKEQALLLHLQRQFNLRPLGKGEQAAEGAVSLNRITRETGMDRDTIIKRLSRLREKGIIDFRIAPSNPPIYEVWWNLCFDEWQLPHKHVPTLP